MFINFFLWSIIGILVGLLSARLLLPLRRFLMPGLVGPVVGSFTAGLAYFALRFGKISVLPDSGSVIFSFLGAVSLALLIELLIIKELQDETR